MSVDRDENAIRLVGGCGVEDAEPLAVLCRAAPGLPVDLGGAGLTQFEALVRWEHPERGLLLPADFLPSMEGNATIVTLGRQVLDQVCAQIASWQRGPSGTIDVRVSVNVSAHQLMGPAYAAAVRRVLDETGVDPARLRLEVTESVFLADAARSLLVMHELRDLGVGLSLDDFGTGYSSLAYLKQLPVQTLKIDRSFIKDISTDVNEEAIAIAIIQLGKSMNLSVIAEGVETEEQAAFLLRHGCNLAQGYFYSRPVMPDVLMEKYR